MSAVLPNRRLAVLVACCAAVVALAAGCGGGSSSDVPKSAVAVVDGQPITAARFDEVLSQYDQSQRSSKQPVPKPGSTAYKDVVQTKIMPYLVQRAEFEQQAKKLGVVVTPKDVDAALKKIVDQYYGGSQKKFLAAIQKQHTTLANARDSVGFGALENKLVQKLTGSIKVSDAEALAYYKKNISQYKKPASRSLEHILVKTKAEAVKLYGQLQRGASFAALAKKHSTDKGSAVNGGKLGVQPETQLVAPFAKVAFSIKTGVLSQPVHSQFGWHLIKALGPVIPASTSPFSKEKASIVTTLLQSKKSDALAAFQSKMTSYYATRVKYASAYAPPSTAPASTSIIPTATTPTG
jgi:foldase protein PrsA